MIYLNLSKSLSDFICVKGFVTWLWPQASLFWEDIDSGEVR
jgi:hypothetical protein